MNIAYLELRLSGGAMNANPSASLGGVMAGRVIRSKAVDQPQPFSGVTIDDAPGVPDGSITLRYAASTNTFRVTAGGTVGESTVTEDGRVAVPAGAGYLFITVTFADLPDADVSHTLRVSSLLNQVWDDITGAQAYAGGSEYRCIYLVNTHPTQSFHEGKIYVGHAADRAALVTIAKDAAGIGNGVTTGVAAVVANESTAPSPALAFSSSLTAASALAFGTLGPGEARAVWQKRTIPALTSTSSVDEHCSLSISIAC